MHMGIFYYVVNLGLLLIFAFWYMHKYWNDKTFGDFSKGSGEGDKQDGR